MTDGLRVLRTADGGASWRIVFPSAAARGSSNNLGALWFLGREDAWVEQIRFPGTTHPGSTIWWRTRDGGSRWSRALDPPHMPLYRTDIPFDAVSFGSARSGFALLTKLAGTQSPVRRVESLWSSSDGGRTWSRVTAHGLPGNGRELNPSAVSDPFALAAVSSRDAWLARTTGTPGLWRTTDGGGTWSRVRIPTAPAGKLLGAPSFWGDRGVVAVAEPAGRLVVDVSDDGGASWRMATTLRTGSVTPPSGFEAISGSSWLLPSPAGLFRTLDGGQHWSLTRSAVSLGGVTQVGFASESSGLVFPIQPSRPGALRTDNSGRSWSASPFPAPRRPGKPDIQQLTARVAASGAAVVGDGSSLFLRAPGARRWKRVLHPLTPVTGLSFADRHDGWALAAQQLFMTTDGGATWSPRAEPRQGALGQAQLINRRDGVGVACGATAVEALQTSDAGRSWSPLRVPSGKQTLSCDSSLCFATAANGWSLVGGGRHGELSVFHTTDGGQRWSRQLLINGAYERGSIGCGHSTVWVSAYGSPSAAGVPDAVFVSTDTGRSWIDALATGQGRPTAVGLPPARSGAPGEIVDVARTAPRTLVALTACDACGWPGHSYGTLELEVSTDGGRRWHRPGNRLSPLPHVSGGGPTAIAFGSATHGVVLARSATNLYRLNLIETDDQGRTWRRIASFKPPA